MIKWDLNIWKDELAMKTNLQIYNNFKNDFGEEEMYDNMPSIINHIEQRKNKYRNSLYGMCIR